MILSLSLSLGTARLLGSKSAPSAVELGFSQTGTILFYVFSVCRHGIRYGMSRVPLKLSCGSAIEALPRIFLLEPHLGSQDTSVTLTSYTRYFDQFHTKDYSLVSEFRILLSVSLTMEWSGAQRASIGADDEELCDSQYAMMDMFNHESWSGPLVQSLRLPCIAKSRIK